MEICTEIEFYKIVKNKISHILNRLAVVQVFFVWWVHLAADRDLQGLVYYNTHLSCHSNCLPWGRSALLPGCMSPSVSLSFFLYILQREMADEVTGLEFLTRKHFQCTQYIFPLSGFTNNKITIVLSGHIL